MAAILIKSKADRSVSTVSSDRGTRHRRLPPPPLELPEVEGHPQATCDDLSLIHI